MRGGRDDCFRRLTRTRLQAEFRQENREDLYEHIEETVFRAAYRFCHGNQLQTGRLLGISRNIVRARLEKIGELETSPRHNVVSLVGK